MIRAAWFLLCAGLAQAFAPALVLHRRNPVAASFSTSDTRLGRSGPISISCQAFDDFPTAQRRPFGFSPSGARRLGARKRMPMEWSKFHHRSTRNKEVPPALAHCAAVRRPSSLWWGHNLVHCSLRRNCRSLPPPRPRSPPHPMFITRGACTIFPPHNPEPNGDSEVTSEPNGEPKPRSSSVALGRNRIPRLPVSPSCARVRAITLDSARVRGSSPPPLCTRALCGQSSCLPRHILGDPRNYQARPHKAPAGSSTQLITRHPRADGCEREHAIAARDHEHTAGINEGRGGLARAHLGCGSGPPFHPFH